MNTTKDFIIEQLKKEIVGFKAETKTHTVGRVTEIGDGIAKISGLSDVMMSEMLEFSAEGRGKIYGVALNLEEDSVGAIILGDFTGIKEGDEVRATRKILEVPVGEMVSGRVINPLGEAMDGKGNIETNKFYPIEKIAPGVITRQSETPKACAAWIYSISRSFKASPRSRRHSPVQLVIPRIMHKNNSLRSARAVTVSNISGWVSI